MLRQRQLAAFAQQRPAIDQHATFGIHFDVAGPGIGLFAIGGLDRDKAFTTDRHIQLAARLHQGSRLEVGTGQLLAGHYPAWITITG